MSADVMNTVYHAAALFLLLTIGGGLVRIWRGPTAADRLLAIQLFGTTGTAILILLSLAADNQAYQNVALIFALLAGILGVVFTRYGQPAALPTHRMYFKMGARVVGHRLRRDGRRVTPEAMTHKTNSAPNVKYTPTHTDEEDADDLG